MVNEIVVRDVEDIVNKWGDFLISNGYSAVERDLTSDGKWHGEYPNEIRDLGKVAFWSRKGLDGVVVSRCKTHPYPQSNKTMMFEDIKVVGEATYEHLRRLGYESAEMIDDHEETLTVNGREHGSIALINGVSLHDLISGRRSVE